MGLIYIAAKSCNTFWRQNSGMKSRPTGLLLGRTSWRWKTHQTYRFILCNFNIQKYFFVNWVALYTRKQISLHMQWDKLYQWFVDKLPTDGKRNPPSFCLLNHFSALAALLDTTGVKPIIRFRPCPLQHDRIHFWDGSHDSSSQLRQTLWWREQKDGFFNFSP